MSEDKHFDANKIFIGLIVFTALDRLYVAVLPDGTPERLTNQDVGEYHPTWSPDGKSVVANGLG